MEATMTMICAAPLSQEQAAASLPGGERFESGHHGWPLDAVKLVPVMERTGGASDVIVGLIDGPVIEHPHLAAEHIRVLRSRREGSPTTTPGAAHAHGTYVAGILSARRGSSAPSICPGCTLLVRPVFMQSAPGAPATPTASPDEVSDAIVDCVDAGARVLNLSVALVHASPDRYRPLEAALDHAARRGAIVVAAAGNQGIVGGSPITSHPWTIAVAACDRRGRPSRWSNLGGSIARHGLLAPGEDITSLDAAGTTITHSGTSAGAPFVTGAIALLWSLFPDALPQHVRAAVAGPARRRSGVVPPVLDAWNACQHMQRLGGCI